MKDIQLKSRRTAMEENIKNAIAQIRPYLQRDGGDIQFIEYIDDHIVKVQLQGHCAGCPGATMTIKGVIERLLRETYPEIQGVEAVSLWQKNSPETTSKALNSERPLSSGPLFSILPARAMRRSGRLWMLL